MALIQQGNPYGGEAFGGPQRPRMQQQPQQPQTDRYSQYASQQPEYAGRSRSPQPQSSGMMGGMRGDLMSRGLMGPRRPFMGGGPQAGGMGMGQPGGDPFAAQRGQQQQAGAGSMLGQSSPSVVGGSSPPPPPQTAIAPGANTSWAPATFPTSSGSPPDPGAPPPPAQLGGANKGEDFPMAPQDPQSGAIAGSDPYSQIPQGLRPTPQPDAGGSMNGLGDQSRMNQMGGDLLMRNMMMRNRQRQPWGGGRGAYGQTSQSGGPTGEQGSPTFY